MKQQTFSDFEYSNRERKAKRVGVPPPAEAHGLNELFFYAINRVMVQTGHMSKSGTMVDDTIINALPSTKNTQKRRDSEMHQTKKGDKGRFGMKLPLASRGRSLAAM